MFDALVKYDRYGFHHLVKVLSHHPNDFLVVLDVCAEVAHTLDSTLLQLMILAVDHRYAELKDGEPVLLLQLRSKFSTEYGNDSHDVVLDPGIRRLRQKKHHSKDVVHV